MDQIIHCGLVVAVVRSEKVSEHIIHSVSCLGPLDLVGMVVGARGRGSGKRQGVLGGGSGILVGILDDMDRTIGIDFDKPSISLCHFVLGDGRLQVRKIPS